MADPRTRTVADVSLTNPYQEYRITSVNRGYGADLGNDSRFALQFRNGIAVAHAMDPNTTPADAIRQRISHLGYFQNTPERARPQRRFDEQANMLREDWDKPDWVRSYTVEAIGRPFAIPVRLKELLHAPGAPLAWEPDDHEWITGGPNFAERSPTDEEREALRQAEIEASYPQPATITPKIKNTAAGKAHPLDAPAEEPVPA